MRALNREYPGETSALRSVRRDVANFLIECGADTQALEQATLIASELATNAIQASPGRPFQLHAQCESHETVSLALHSRGAQSVPPPRASWALVDQLANSGRGLAIVGSLSDEVTVETKGDEVTVTARFRIWTG